jgi:hypothetical protein
MWQMKITTTSTVITRIVNNSTERTVSIRRVASTPSMVEAARAATTSTPTLCLSPSTATTTTAIATRRERPLLRLRLRVQGGLVILQVHPHAVVHLALPLHHRADHQLINLQ